MELKINFPGIQTRLLPEEEAVVMDVIHNADGYSMGVELKKLEQNFAEKMGMKYAVGVSSCTAALELATILTGVGPGDEVILPAHTFTATALPFMRSGAKLVFADIDPETFVISYESIVQKITENTKVIIPVHLYGLMAPMDRIMALAEKKGLFVIEDVAQAPGASINGKLAGSWGDASCFSFHSQKNITALGEGGMLLTNIDDWYQKCLGLRKIGSSPYLEERERYWIPAMSNVIEAVPGKLPYNFALAEPNAAAANCLLQRLETINNHRNIQANTIRDLLSKYIELEFQRIPAGYYSAYHLLVARYKSDHSNRDDLIEILFNKYGIKCVVQYYPLYNYELFKNNGYSEKDCPESDKFFDSMISFPFWSDMPEHDINYLVSSIKSAINQLRKG